MPVLRSNKLHHAPEDDPFLQEEDRLPELILPADGSISRAAEEKEPAPDPPTTAPATDAIEQALTLAKPRIHLAFWKRIGRLFR